MERDDLWDVSDAKLIALIERLDYGGGDRGELSAALDELFRRLRLEAAPGERAHVEKVIAWLARIFSHDDDDDDGPPQIGGVREPRRPPPDRGTGSVHLAS